MEFLKLTVILSIAVSSGIVVMFYVLNIVFHLIERYRSKKGYRYSQNGTEWYREEYEEEENGIV